MALLSDGTAQYAHLWIIESCDDLGMSLFFKNKFFSINYPLLYCYNKKKLFLNMDFFNC